ncbi:MAG TPA: helicase C-terminal domain-containing protein [Opitutales bacterium]|jgi:DNA excision repair protein ERCC-2|nr:helicase C-terminal domain-containing protein [Opitutales bacterium]
MQFITGQRTVEMSVGEFATFNPVPSSSGFGRMGAWRAAAGTAWHKTLREREEVARNGAQFEVPIQARLLHRGWSIDLQGRLDQLVPHNGGWLLREIKTVSASLPCAEDELAQAYPEHFRQLATYLRMAELGELGKKGPLAGELVLVDLATGITQTVPMAAPAANVLVEVQLETLRPYLEYRWDSRQRIAALTPRLAFTNLRPGQAEARAELASAAGHSGVFLFEAPTGFGKTGLLLEYALARLRDGHCHRLLYLTGKGTGQAPVTKQLRSLLGATPELRFIQLRSRREHAIDSPRHTCDVRRSCRTNLEERWREAGLDPWTLFEDGSLPVEKSRRLGAEIGVCPYEITRAALPCAEVIICDYNYVFSPGHSSVLSNLPGFNPSDTLLVLDEAHNLPARAAEARSHVFAANIAAFAAHALSDFRARAALTQAAESFADFLHTLQPSERLDLTTQYSIESHLEAIADELNAGPLPEDFPDGAADFLWSTVNALDTLRDHSLELLPHAPAAGELRLTCVDAAPAIGAALNDYVQAVLTSATFGPPEFFLAACGLQKDKVHWIAAHAPWRDGVYDIAVDARVDTRQRARAQYFALTAQTICDFAGGQARPIAVFFPSYDYAETIRTYIEAVDPGLRVAMQPRGADLAGQTLFLDEALLTAHAIFFVLGGSFAEGIDRLGGEVERAMVVGPAVSEPNALNKARQAHYELTMDPAEAFRRTYLAPGILKVAQALGRLVRAPGHHAKILLHCRRFSELTTQNLLPEEYRAGKVLRRDIDFLEWLKK